MGNDVDDIGKKLLKALRGQAEEEFSIELTPDRSNDSETYLLTGNQAELRFGASLIMAIRQLLQNKDIGSFIASPYEPFAYSNTSPLSIQVHWRLLPEPPFEKESLWLDPKLRNRASLPRPYLTIPCIRRSAVTWERIKELAGGQGGYFYGPHYANARLVSRDGKKLGKGGRMILYSNSEADSIRMLKGWLNLCDVEGFTITHGEESQEEGVRAKESQMRKPAVRIYPAWMTIINSQLVRKNYDQISTMGHQKGRATVAGKKLQKQGKIPLWYKTPPGWVNEMIRDLLSFGDEDDS